MDTRLTFVFTEIYIVPFHRTMIIDITIKTFLRKRLGKFTCPVALGKIILIMARINYIPHRGRITYPEVLKPFLVFSTNLRYGPICS